MRYFALAISVLFFRLSYAGDPALVYMNLTQEISIQNEFRKERAGRKTPKLFIQDGMVKPKNLIDPAKTHCSFEITYGKETEKLAEGQACYPDLIFPIGKFKLYLRAVGFEGNSPDGPAVWMEFFVNPYFEKNPRTGLSERKSRGVRLQNALGVYTDSWIKSFRCDGFDLALEDGKSTLAPLFE